MKGISPLSGGGGGKEEYPSRHVDPAVASPGLVRYIKRMELRNTQRSGPTGRCGKRVDVRRFPGGFAPEAGAVYAVTCSESTTFCSRVGIFSLCMGAVSSVA